MADKSIYFYFYRFNSLGVCKSTSISTGLLDPVYDLVLRTERFAYVIYFCAQVTREQVQLDLL